MKRTGAFLATLTLALTLSACSSASPGDKTACELTANANNAMAQAVKTANQNEDSDNKSLYRELVLAARDDIGPQLALAISKANDATLLKNLYDLSTYYAGMTAGSDDSGIAYFMQLQTVADTCKALGAKIVIESNG